MKAKLHTAATPSPSTAAPPKPTNAAKPAKSGGARSAPQKQAPAGGSAPAGASAPAAPDARPTKKATRAKRRHRFRWPVYGWVTSNFGPRRSGFHHGLDIACAWGTPIIASHSGRVMLRGRNWVYGKMVVIGTPTGWSTLYGHMNTTWVKTGRRVKQGDVIGTCGNTGASTGNHLHFEVRKGGRYWDPRKILP